MGSVHSESNPLGQASEYKDQYDAGLLFPIDRQESWRAQGLDRSSASFFGEDIWNAYELSWLNERGKPMVAMAEFRIPAASPFLIESKSFKLYLNSFNQTRFASAAEVVQHLERDLSGAAGAAVQATLLDVEHAFSAPPQAVCIDELDVDIDSYQPDPSLLRCADGEFDGWLCSHLLKSNCPVTGQPDWGSLYIHYRGQRIDEAALLKYVISLRQHQDFHEQCVERTFMDLMTACQPEALTVYARYVRRGGLDINPMRSTDSAAVAVNFRLARQ
ncbi:NADPH-dependent 7-cyano-7-deazaguanine reductase QueF [Bacterioplanes sanyensis]|uniref:NADPH-dependent 7-cyano-7-deazaguanine reductase n=1 Tax=Bacterioplanes sanyensis TaxID=1249553 RepID=A0A222FKL5_9GAMM|nr:NADPH-dependent 7-cyano-7-deazaguanine reductase QueF [Bacterioplanes sanyensis]ASP39587.1 NADPH-dependent 7-cyano-7-deazaguanine reductase QueF [Bacterioplanes sanyensis]